MAKGNRSRANPPKKPDEPPKPKEPGFLTQQEGAYFKELIDLNNRLAKIKKQHEIYKFTLGKLKDIRKKIQKGEIELPVYLTLIPNESFYPESDKKKVLAYYDDKIKGIQDAIKGITGQVENSGEMYKECGIRAREALNRKFGDFVAKFVSYDRMSIPDEREQYAKEFEDLVKSVQFEDENGNKLSEHEFKELAKKKAEENTKNRS